MTLERSGHSESWHPLATLGLPVSHSPVERIGKNPVFLWAEAERPCVNSSCGGHTILPLTVP